MMLPPLCLTVSLDLKASSENTSCQCGKLQSTLTVLVFGASFLFCTLQVHVDASGRRCWCSSGFHFMIGLSLGDWVAPNHTIQIHFIKGRRSLCLMVETWILLGVPAG
ncbi:hypothetical protein ATANTOWER_000485 [Ataeniobius toweri]|uniref:Secreted protein n=1 Tax=Ataeniobius toweri TaxID=208326 RepID=A0ABU7BFP4_9TELE|nr:hypothetical protein [Ataeniobius toweri]